ncbi:MAG TPA: SDR family oxidoreductase [Polyangiales bacterium]|nr:SDR family oxidoreductase [Polyangiales bacterium]
MTSIQGKTALVIGGSSGVGRATVQSLISAGARVTAVARGAEALESLRAETAGAVQTFRADAAAPETAPRLLRELRPELVVLAAGVRPRMAALDEQTWETFSATWNSDVQASFHLIQAALSSPLAPGSTVVLVSSGAAINGSSLSGGYAGAKRAQWLLAGYAQQLSEKRKLGIRFLAVLPRQLIADTEIARAAASAYGAALGISSEEHMKRFGKPLTVEGVAAAIVGGLQGEVAPGVNAIGVSGESVEPLA